MKNNEHEAMDTNEAGGMHERLCAYVLGELDGAERAALEIELAENAELRAEKDRIEATISLVTSTYAADESLAPEILGALERAARPAPTAPAPISRIQPWYTRAPFQAAAGLAAIVTGVVGGRALWDDDPLSSLGRPSKEELAWLDESSVDPRGFGAAKGDPLTDFDAEIAQGSAMAPASENAPKESGSRDELVAGVELRRLQESADSNLAGLRKVRGGESDARARRELTYAESPQAEEFDNGSTSWGPESSTETATERSKDSTVGLARVARVENDTVGRGAGNYRGPGDSAVPGQPQPDPSPGGPVDRFGKVADKPGLASGSDDFFLGKGQAADADNKAVKAADEVVMLERARKRALIVTSSGSSGASSSGANGRSTTSTPGGGGGGGGGGPSTPGPAGPSAPGASRASVGAVSLPPPSETRAVRPAVRFELESKRAEAGEVPSAETLVQLEALGYAGGGADGEDTRFGFSLGDAGRRQLTLAELDEVCELRTNRILQDCYRRPNEQPRDMFFRFWGDNSFELAQIDNQSTFGVDVDTASYTLARRYLNDGNLPTKAQIRTEEFVNYFKPDLAAPTGGVFGIHTELAPSRFGNAADAPSQRWLLRVGVRAKEVAREERKPLALTFVVDTSGSMKEENRMELVKHALRLLVAQLDGQDSIAIVGFNNSASVILPMTSAQGRGVIEAAIYGLQPGGGTNAEGGLMLGYEVAAQGLTAGAHNRVVLLSDGVANVGQTDQDRINGSVQSKRDAGIFLNTIGVGMNNHNDVFLEQLANKGDGICNYVDSSNEARRAFVDNFVGAFEPIARDVKIQVEFDRRQVYRYRLLGYENRAIADADFRNDAVDAGEVGSGHQVVALYELELTGAQSTEPLADVRLRWKEPIGPGRDPLEDSATEISTQVSLSQGTTYDAATGGYRRSALVAQFAEILRRSVHARSDSLDELIAESQRLAIQFGDADFAEFTELLHKSRELIVANAPRHNDLSNCIDAIRRNRILRAQLDELKRTENQAVVADLQRQNDELEARIRELIRSELQEEMK